MLNNESGFSVHQTAALLGNGGSNHGCHWATCYGVMLSWGFATWSGGGIEWERKLNNQSGLWLFCLNVAHFFLSPLAAAVAFNSRRTPDFVEMPWPRVFLFFLLGAGFLLSAIMVIATSLISVIEDALLGWLRLLHLTNILASSSVIVVSILSRLPREDRQSVYTLCFVHFAIVAHTAVTVLFLGAIIRVASVASFYGRADALLSWLELSAGLAVLSVLNWRQPSVAFALTGAAAAVAAFAGAWFYAPPFYGGNLRFADWYAIPMTAIPLLLFLGPLARRYQRWRLNRKV